LSVCTASFQPIHRFLSQIHHRCKSCDLGARGRAPFTSPRIYPTTFTPLKYGWLAHVCIMEPNIMLSLLSLLTGPTLQVISPRASSSPGDEIFTPYSCPPRPLASHQRSNVEPLRQLNPRHARSLINGEKHDVSSKRRPPTWTLRSRRVGPSTWVWRACSSYIRWTCSTSAYSMISRRLLLWISIGFHPSRAVLEYTASGVFPVTAFSSYYASPTATSAQPQPVISDPVSVSK